MKLAISGEQLAATHSLRELLDVVERFGVDAVELWPTNLSGGATEEERERYETKAVAEAAALLRERGIAVASVALGFMALPICLARAGTGACTEALQGAVDAALTLGAPVVNCYMVSMRTDAFVAAMKPAATYAAERGVVITLENEAHDQSGLAQNVASIVRAVDSPGFATQYDPCNYYHACQEAYPDAYEVLHPYIRSIHLKGGCLYREDRPGVHRGSHMRGSKTDQIGYLPLPEAAFPTTAILNRLVRDGYDGYVTLEPHVAPEAVIGFYEEEIPFVQSFLNGV